MVGASQRAKSKVQAWMCPWAISCWLRACSQAPEGSSLALALQIRHLVLAQSLFACYIRLVLAALSVPHMCFVMCPCQCSTRIKSVPFACPTSSGSCPEAQEQVVGSAGSLPSSMASASGWWRAFLKRHVSRLGTEGTISRAEHGVGCSLFSLLSPSLVMGILKERCHELG